MFLEEIKIFNKDGIMDGVGRIGSIRSIAESLLPRRNNSLHNPSPNVDQAPPTFNNVFFQKITNKMDSIMKNCQKVNGRHLHISLNIQEC